MSITGTIIANKIELILQDETNVRWTEAELLGWINSAQKEIIVYKPNANPTVASVTTVGGTKQTIPTGGTQFGKVIRNMGVSPGTTPGNAITGINMEVLDGTIPGWHAEAASAVSKHYCFDPLFPKTFYLYPPQPSSSMGFIELAYFSVPTDLATLASNIFDDVYETVILDYALYRCYMKDSEFAGNAQRADYHYKSFMGALTGKTSSEIGLAPEMKFTKRPNAQG